jgi:hypothetical protein
MTPIADRPLVHMGAGFLLMGGWAFLANLGHPMPAPLVAGLVQGTLTALITLGLKRMVEGIVARTSGWAAVLLPPLAACAVSVTLLATIHRLAGTPEVLRTLALPATVSTLYALLWALRLRERRHG